MARFDWKSMAGEERMLFAWGLILLIGFGVTQLMNSGLIRLDWNVHLAGWLLLTLIGLYVTFKWPAKVSRPDQLVVKVWIGFIAVATILTYAILLYAPLLALATWLPVLWLVSMGVAMLLTGSAENDKRFLHAGALWLLLAPIVTFVPVLAAWQWGVIAIATALPLFWLALVPPAPVTFE